MRRKLTSSVMGIASLGIGILCWAVAHAADKEVSPMKVKVEVSAIGNIKTEFESYIKRELRGLKDVEIVENDPNYTLGFVVLGTGPKNGPVTGYAISEVLTHRFSQFVLERMFKDKLSKDGMALLKGATESVDIVDNHQLFLCSPSDLKSTCERIIAGFDTDTLEPGRKMIRQFKDLIEKNQKKPE